jgi:hypothetical protein
LNTVYTELGAYGPTNYILLALGGSSSQQGTLNITKFSFTGSATQGIGIADYTAITWSSTQDTINSGTTVHYGTVASGTPTYDTGYPASYGTGVVTAATAGLAQSGGISPAYTAMVAASNYFATQVTAANGAHVLSAATLLNGTLAKNDNVTWTGVSGENVVNLTTLSMAGGATITLTGPADADFIINVSGAINITNGQILVAGSVNSDNVIINETGGASQAVTLSGNTKTVIDATVLAPLSAITMDGVQTGEIIGGYGQTITLQSGGSTTHGPPTCFTAGTAIATPDGERAVETLTTGDVVIAIVDGARVERTVLWLGSQAVSRRFADPLRLNPIRIRAGALGEATPSRDLLVSPAHAMLVDGVLVQAGAMVNGSSVVRETATPEHWTYYHIELADHALVLAEGALAESFIDNVERMAFDNWSDNLEARAGHGQLVEMSYPRAQSARQLPRRVQALLAERAVTIGLELSSAA